MEAKDTVMSMEGREPFADSWGFVCKKGLLEAQAEISFRAGIKELISKMALERCDPDVMPYFEDYYYIPKSVLKDLLREWGIE